MRAKADRLQSEINRLTVTKTYYEQTVTQSLMLHDHTKQRMIAEHRKKTNSKVQKATAELDKLRNMLKK